MPGRLADKIVIVTGGGSGFGKGIAAKFVQEGAKVIIAELSEESGMKAAKELNCEYAHADVTKKASWESLLKKAVDTYGGLDIVINNAGGTYSNKPTLDVSEAEFDLCVNLNMRSVYQSVGVIVPYMKEKKKGGVFVNIASTAGIRPRPGLAWYCASKAAVSCATKAMAVEFAPDQIRFNAVCPVVGSTGMTHLFLGKPDTPENIAALQATIPLGRTSTPRDVANACCYLASDEGDFITGVNLEVDGGRCV